MEKYERRHADKSDSENVDDHCENRSVLLFPNSVDSEMNTVVTVNFDHAGGNITQKDGLEEEKHSF